MIQNRGLNVAELDTHATNLDLIVHSAREFEHSVGSHSAEIARAVQCCRCDASELIVHEPLGGQFGAVKITACDPRSTDVDFTHYAGRDELPLPIENVNLCIGDRAPDRNGGLTGDILATPVQRGDRRLGRSVAIVKCRRRKPLANASLQRDATEPSPPVVRRRSEPQRAISGSSMIARSSDGTKQATVMRCSAISFTRYALSYSKRGRVNTRQAPALKGSRISHTESSKLNDARLQTSIRWLDREIAAAPRQVIRYSPVGDEHSLGRPRRAGRVNDICDVRRAHRYPEIIVR